MYARIIQIPANKSFFLFGPRATGKTTWLRKLFPDAVYIDLLRSDVYTMLLAAPERLTQFIPPDCRKPIIIDEVQRVPELLNEVHRLIEQAKQEQESRGLRFILTGSSARKLRSKGVNLLAGRALTRFMYPLTVEELGNDFSLETSLEFGHLPAIYSEPDPADYLASYVRTYLREEVLQEGLTRNLQVFARFLEAASFSQGAVLNISEVARECGAGRKLVEQYFHILDDLFLAHRLPVFTKRAKRRMVRHPKFYFFDTGVYRAIRPKGPLDRPEEIEGTALETLVFQELLAVRDLHRLGYELFYWRTSNGQEVDFVLYGEAGVVAIEVQWAAKVRSRELRGLKAFARDYPQASLYIFYGGDTTMYIDDITLMPVQEALRQLPSLCVP